MNITQTRMLTRLRTWMLVAGLTAIVITLGALIGGVFAWLFAAIAVGANLIGYFYSDRIALRLYLMPGEQPNAFATGRDPHHAAIAVTQGLLVGLPLAQIRGVLAHELAHIKNRDILVSSLAATIAGAISAIVNVLQFSFLFGGEEENGPLGMGGAFAAMLLAPLGAMLLQLGVSRQREYLADASAAQLLGSGAPLADALDEIARDRSALQVNPVSAPMYIINPLSGVSAKHLFSTHPPVRERIRRLRAYDRAARPNVAVLRSDHAKRWAA